MMRLDKFLTECGLGTRSEVKKRIKTKQITVNGETATKPEQKVEENKDQICYQNRILVYAKYHYYLFHKPSGCVTAVRDEIHQTVMDYFPEEVRRGLSPVGRLDLDTEGLLLLTDNGELNHHLTSPGHHVRKCYYARLDAPVPESAVEAFSRGIDIGDAKNTLPAQLKIFPIETDSSGNPSYAAELTITEGRYHQVKRMFHAVGCEVIYLKRLTMGTLELGELAPGEYRILEKNEIENLLKSTE